MRVLDWNVRMLADDPVAVIEVVRDIAPDVLLLQEVPQYLAPVARLRWFAARCGLRILVGGRGCGGLALLAADPVAATCVAAGVSLLPRRFAPPPAVPRGDTLRGLPRVRSALAGGALAEGALAGGALIAGAPLVPQFRRGTAAARLRLAAGRDLVVASVHLSLDPGERLAQTRRLLTDVTRSLTPVVLGGDFNERAGRPARELLNGVFTDPLADLAGGGAPIRGDTSATSDTAATFPARRPLQRIDGILLTDGLRAGAGKVVRSTVHVAAGRVGAASDHLPQWLDVEL